MFNFTRNCQIVFQSNTSFCVRSSYFCASLPVIWIVNFLYFSHFNSTERYTILVLICSSLPMNDIEYIFMCIFAICVFSSKGVCYFVFFFSRCFAHFYFGLFAFILLNIKSYLYILDISILSNMYLENTSLVFG